MSIEKRLFGKSTTKWLASMGTREDLYEKNKYVSDSKIEPGLIKIIYPYKETSKEELALILTPDLAKSVLLPNDVLCYRDFLRDSRRVTSKGIEIIGPFSGSVILNKYIKKINGKAIQLNEFFCYRNFKDPLIACNNPHFEEVIYEMGAVLIKEGFDVDNLTFEDYEKWEKEKLKTFYTPKIN